MPIMDKFCSFVAKFMERYGIEPLKLYHMKVQIKLYHFSPQTKEIVDFRGEFVVDSPLRFDVNSYVEVLKSLYPYAVMVEFSVYLK